MSILSLNSSYGLPLCLSGITHPLSLSTEMADHDRRREAMKRVRRGVFGADQERGSIVIFHEGITGREIDGDVARVLHDLSSITVSFTAKAA